jgi:hypothetical protein
MNQILLVGMLLTSVVGAGAVGTTMMMSGVDWDMMGGGGCPMRGGYEMHEECEEHMEEHCGDMSHEECDEMHEECEEYMDEYDDEEHGCDMWR